MDSKVFARFSSQPLLPSLGLNSSALRLPSLRTPQRLYQELSNRSSGVLPCKQLLNLVKIGILY